MSGCEAVGIRLREGEDFPYFETAGFPARFVRMENQLCAVDSQGRRLRDGQGNPVLECMCGNILCGRFDPARPFFTVRGSFWTNSTTQLLASTTAADRQARTRNRCHGEGYESVALIPLRAGGETFGLLQFNDPRPGRFTPEKIARLEQLAGYLAIALAQRQAENALWESERKFQGLFESSRDALMTLEPPFWRFTSGNPATVKMFGVKNAEEFTSLAPWELSPERQPDGRASAEKAAGMIERAMREGSHSFEWTHRRVNGEEFPATVLLSRMEFRGKAFLQASIRDITGRKQAEKDLQEAADRFQLVTRATNDAIWDWNLTGPAWWNDAFYEVYGFDRNAPPSLEAWASHIHPDDRERVTARFRAAVEHGETTWVDEFRFRRADGTYGHVFDRAYSLRDASGKIVRMLGSMMDITERKRAEEALRESEQRYRQLFETESDAIFLMDSESGRFVDANQSALKMYGYSREEFLCLSHVDVSAEPDQTRQAVAAKQTAVPLRWHRRKDGAVFPVEISGGYFESQGRKMHVAAIRDITLRQRAEQQLRDSEQFAQSTIDALSAHLCVLDETGRILAVNQAWRDFASANGVLASKCRGRRKLSGSLRRGHRPGCRRHRGCGRWNPRRPARPTQHVPHGIRLPCSRRAALVCRAGFTFSRQRPRPIGCRPREHHTSPASRRCAGPIPGATIGAGGKHQRHDLVGGPGTFWPGLVKQRAEGIFRAEPRL